MKDLDKFKEKLASRNINFESAAVDKVTELKVYVDMVLEVLGHEEAFVTDESEIFDFMDIFYEPEEKESLLDDLRENLGVEIEDGYKKIIDIAQRLKEKK